MVPHPRGASQVALGVKNPPANAGDVRDMGSSPRSGRSLGGGHGNPLQYPCQSPWTEEPGGLQSMRSLGSLRVRTVNAHTRPSHQKPFSSPDGEPLSGRKLLRQAHLPWVPCCADPTPPPPPPAWLAPTSLSSLRPVSPPSREGLRLTLPPGPHHMTHRA